MTAAAWKTSTDGCALVMAGGKWSICRYPAPRFERAGGEIVYLLFCKRTTATGDRMTEVIERRALPLSDGPGRSRAVAELREVAER